WLKKRACTPSTRVFDDMTGSSTKLLNIIALLSMTAVGVALISQHVFAMPPCAWCVLQRLVFIAIALVCWGGLAITRLGAAATRCLMKRVLAALVFFLSLSGVAAAWYQYTVASAMFSCDLTF